MNKLHHYLAPKPDIIPPIGVSRKIDQTSAKAWRSRRDCVIYIAARAGISQRWLADVFDLPRSRIAVIIKQVGATLPDAKEN
jgi:hypothetical protein